MSIAIIVIIKEKAIEKHRIFILRPYHYLGRYSILLHG